MHFQRHFSAQGFPEKFWLLPDPSDLSPWHTDTPLILCPLSSLQPQRQQHPAYTSPISHVYDVPLDEVSMGDSLLDPVRLFQRVQLWKWNSVQKEAVTAVTNAAVIQRRVIPVWSNYSGKPQLETIPLDNSPTDARQSCLLAFRGFIFSLYHASLGALQPAWNRVDECTQAGRTAPAHLRGC